MILGRDMVSIQDHEVTSEDETEIWRKRQKDVCNLKKQHGNDFVMNVL